MDMDRLLQEMAAMNQRSRTTFGDDATLTDSFLAVAQVERLTADDARRLLGDVEKLVALLEGAS